MSGATLHERCKPFTLWLPLPSSHKSMGSALCNLPRESSAQAGLALCLTGNGVPQSEHLFWVMFVPLLHQDSIMASALTTFLLFIAPRVNK